MSSQPATYIFDAYGTLFDVHSAVARLSARVGPDAQALSEMWRSRQLEYSWTYSLMGRAANFWELTELSLDFAMAKHGITDPQLRSELLRSYIELEAFPEVPRVLRRLKASGKGVVILSNGTASMVRSAAESAGLAALVDDVLSVDAVGVFKPDRRVYQYAVDILGIEPSAISFQSSNAWDAAGAANFGFPTIWVNRRRMPGEYKAVGQVREVASLEALLEAPEVPL